VECVGEVEEATTAAGSENFYYNHHSIKEKLPTVFSPPLSVVDQVDGELGTISPAATAYARMKSSSCTGHTSREGLGPNLIRQNFLSVAGPRAGGGIRSCSETERSIGKRLLVSVLFKDTFSRTARIRP
jgi:hypothetical protein